MENLDWDDFIDYDEWVRYEDLKRESPLPARFTDCVEGFAAAGLPELLKQAPEPNVVYSPVCLMLAIGMLISSSEKGVAEEVKLQLERCAEAAELSQDELEEGFAALVKHIGANPFADVRSACAAWASKQIAAGRTTAARKLARVYGAEARGTDFGSPEASAEIRDWIGQKTNGMLRPEVQTDASMVALLVSCLYARLTWALEFDLDETGWGAFFKKDGDTGDARFMHDEFTRMSYCSGEGFTRVSLPCEGECSVDFLMPEDASALTDSEFVLNAFSAHNNRRADVDLYLPRFEVESDVDGKRLLDSLRINGVFKMQENNPLVGGPFQVTDVIHGAKVKVDERGLEGAAYTMMPVCAGVPPERTPLEKVTIRFDHPFAFRVVTDDGVPLFMGVVTDPTVSAREPFFESEENHV